jgi:pimeloyl-ACP methyl ester carboxylesterase
MVFRSFFCWPMFGLFVGLGLLSVSLSGCQNPLPFDLPFWPKEKTEAKQKPDKEATAEGEKGSAAKAQAPKKIWTPDYRDLWQCPSLRLESLAKDGSLTIATLYDPLQVEQDKAKRLKPPAPAKPIEAEEGAEEEGDATPEEPDGSSGEETSSSSGESDAEEASSPSSLTQKKLPAVASTPKPVYPLLVLLHSLHESSKVWDSLAVGWLQQGYAVLIIDLPGFGQSTHFEDGSTVGWRDYTEDQWKSMPTKVLGLLQTLEKKGPTLCPQVQVSQRTYVGVGFGGTLALMLAGQSPPQTSALVAIAPNVRSKGIEPIVPFLDYEGPVFLAASPNDPPTLEATKRLHKIGQGEKAMKLYDTLGSAMDILKTDPKALNEVTTWLKTHVPPAKALAPAFWLPTEVKLPPAKPAAPAEEEESEG